MKLEEKAPNQVRQRPAPLNNCQLLFLPMKLLIGQLSWHGVVGDFFYYYNYFIRQLFLQRHLKTFYRAFSCIDCFLTKHFAVQERQIPETNELYVVQKKCLNEIVKYSDGLAAR